MEREIPGIIMESPGHHNICPVILELQDGDGHPIVLHTE